MAKEASQPRAKIVRFKLTKEQKKYVDDMHKLEQRILIVREYIDLWMKFFSFFSSEIHEREITAAEEKSFFQLMTQLSRKQFQFVEAAANTYDGGDDVMKVLCAAVSLAHIQVMKEATFGKLELDWHTQLIAMNKAAGRLLRQLPGEMTLSEALEYIDKVGSGEAVKPGSKSKAAAKAAAKEKKPKENKSKDPKADKVGA